MPQHPVFIQGKPMNAAARRSEQHKIYINNKVIENYRNARDNKFSSSLKSIPERFRASVPYALLLQEHERYRFAPFATIAIGRAASRIYKQYKPIFSKFGVSLPSFYFNCLLQLENQICSVSDPSIPFMFLRGLKKRDLEFRNFPLINRFIGTFGVFRSSEVDYHFVVPLGTELNPNYITSDRLENVLEWLSSRSLNDLEARKAFLMSDALPGALYDETTYSLCNAEDYVFTDNLSLVVDAAKCEDTLCAQGIDFIPLLNDRRPEGFTFFLPHSFELDWIKSFDAHGTNSMKLVDLWGFDISVAEARDVGIPMSCCNIEVLTVFMDPLMSTLQTRPRVTKFGIQQWKTKFKVSG